MKNLKISLKLILIQMFFFAIFMNSGMGSIKNSQENDYNYSIKEESSEFNDLFMNPDVIVKIVEFYMDIESIIKKNIKKKINLGEKTYLNSKNIYFNDLLNSFSEGSKTFFTCLRLLGYKKTEICESSEEYFAEVYHNMFIGSLSKLIENKSYAIIFSSLNIYNQRHILLFVRLFFKEDEKSIQKLKEITPIFALKDDKHEFELLSHLLKLIENNILQNKDSKFDKNHFDFRINISGEVDISDFSENIKKAEKIKEYINQIKFKISFSDKDLIFLKDFSQLKILYLSGSNITGEHLDRLPSTLEVLILRESKIKDENIKKLSHLVNLKDLDLMACENIKGEEFENIPQKIRFLVLSNTNMELKNLSKLSHLKNLRFLHLRFCKNLCDLNSFDWLPENLKFLDLGHTNAKFSGNLKNIKPKKLELLI